MKSEADFLPLAEQTVRPDVFAAALEYYERGFSVIPVRGDKKPCIPWTGYRKRRAEPAEIRAWAAKFPDAMIAVVTGGISGILAVDCDTAAGYEAVQKLLPESLALPVARTPRGGWHLWFRYPTDGALTIGAGVMPGVDFRGEGGYIVAPPSVNAEGRAYRWEDGLALSDVEPPRLPGALQSALSINNKNIGYRGGVETAPARADIYKTSSDWQIAGHFSELS